MNEQEKMTKKINNLVIKMLNEGNTYRQIAEKTGYSLSRISRFRKQYVLWASGCSTDKPLI